MVKWDFLTVDDELIFLGIKTGKLSLKSKVGIFTDIICFGVLQYM